jgi:hypothetical protein
MNMPWANWLAERAAFGRHEPERGDVAAERVIRLDRFRDQVRPRRLHALVDVRAVVAPRPAVEAAVADRREIVGNEIIAQLVALVDDRPQRAALRLPGESVRVAQAVAKRRLPGFSRSTSQIAARPSSICMPFSRRCCSSRRHVELAAVAARDQVLRPVVVDPRGQVGHFLRGAGDARVAGLVGKPHDRIGVGDVEKTADERHAERRVEAFEECSARFGNSVAVGIAQQRDAIRARHRRAGLLHRLFMNQALRPPPFSGLGGAALSATSTSPFGST